MSRLVLLDNEAVRALSSARHPKHRKVISHLQVITTRRKRSRSTTVGVPTSVRVEAGWDRRNQAWALANRLGITDMALDQTVADVAAEIRNGLGTHISVADAHLGAVAQGVDSEVTVITNDPEDITAAAGSARATIVRI